MQMTCILETALGVLRIAQEINRNFTLRTYCRNLNIFIHLKLRARRMTWEYLSYISRTSVIGLFRRVGDFYCNLYIYKYVSS
jgi:hypothetical protein